MSERREWWINPDPVRNLLSQNWPIVYTQSDPNCIHVREVLPGDDANQFPTEIVFDDGNAVQYRKLHSMKVAFASTFEELQIERKRHAALLAELQQALEGYYADDLPVTREDVRNWILKLQAIVTSEGEASDDD